MTTTRPAVIPEPAKQLLSWDVCYKGHPGKGQRCVDIQVWVPTPLVRWEQEHCWDSGQCRLTRLAAYLQENLGFTNCASISWGFRNAGDDALTCVTVPVRTREVRAALADRAATISP